jgi:hypothetical protein
MLRRVMYSLEGRADMDGYAPEDQDHPLLTHAPTRASFCLSDDELALEGGQSERFQVFSPVDIAVDPGVQVTASVLREEN